MRFAVLDTEGIGLSWATRLHDEGHDVLYYVHERCYREVGTGIVNKSGSIHEIFGWAKLKPTVAVFMFSGMGKAQGKVPIGADEFRNAGIPTILGGSLPDRMEGDRVFGLKMAKDIGIRRPPTFHFSTVEDAQAFLKHKGSSEWYFKPNVRPDGDCDTTQGGAADDLTVYLDYYKERNGNHRSNVLQMKIPGVGLSTNGWFNGKVFLQPLGGTLEHKKLMNDEKGPSTGCALNVVWFYPEQSKIHSHYDFEKLGQILASKNAPPGLYDINAVIAEESGPWGPKGVPYFLEWTPRLGFDSEVVSPRLMTMPLGSFIQHLGQGTLPKAPFRTDKLGFSTHLSISPYPWGDPDMLSKLSKTARGARLSGIKSLWADNFACYGLGKNGKGFYVANDEGNVGVALAVGSSLKALNEEALKFAESLVPKSMQYRTDGAKVLAADAKKLEDLGYSVPGGIMR